MHTLLVLLTPQCLIQPQPLVDDTCLSPVLVRLLVLVLMGFHHRGTTMQSVLLPVGCPRHRILGHTPVDQ